MCTEILNFVAAAHSLEMISEYPVTDQRDRDELIRNLISYGPAINDEK